MQYPSLMEVMGSVITLCFGGYYIITVRRIYVTINFRGNINLDKCESKRQAGVAVSCAIKRINKIVQFTGMGKS